MSADTNTKHGMGWSMRHVSWRGCLCRFCKPHRDRGKFKRTLHKLARQESRRTLRAEGNCD